MITIKQYPKENTQFTITVDTPFEGATIEEAFVRSWLIRPIRSKTIRDSLTGKAVARQHFYWEWERNQVKNYLSNKGFHFQEQ